MSFEVEGSGEIANRPIRECYAARVASWWQSAVVYEVYLRSFQDSDGDGIGDLQGLRSRLDYLAWLGVDAIWISPIYPSPNADYGYDVADHKAIAPEFGTDEDFDELIAAAHQRGIRVLMDLVVGHTSIEHPWFRDHPDRYIWAEDGPANNWMSSFGGPAWSHDERTGRWYLRSFYPEQPDLDWRNPDVRQAMGEVIGHWLQRGVDGFRIDAIDRMVKDADLRDDPPSDTPFPLPMPPGVPQLDLIHSRDDPEIVTALESLREAAGEALLVGEVYLPADRVGRYLDHLDRVFAFDLMHATPNASEIAAALQPREISASLAWVTSNHDFARVATRWGERNARAAALLLLTLPGCAFIYQGEEIGMVDGPEATPPLDRFGRDSVRNPMQWEPEPRGGFTAAEPWLPMADPELRSVADQRGSEDSILGLFRALIAARRSLVGPLERIEAREGVLSYRRGRHLVVANFDPQPRTHPALSEGEVVLSTGLIESGDPGLQPGGGALLALDV